MAAFRIPRHPEAFSNSPTKGNKRPRIKDNNHLAWIRTLPCIVTGVYGVEAAHIRYSEPRYGKREAGKAEKPDDAWVVPLSPEMHRLQHSMNEREFWEEQGIDPCAVALALKYNSGDDEQAVVIIRNAKNKK